MDTSLAAVILVSSFCAALTQPCCSPAQFMSGVLQRRGSYNRETDTAVAYHDHMRLTYDYTKRRAACVQRKYNSTYEERVHIILDFKKELQYKILNDKKCVKTSLSGAKMTSPCFLTDAQSLGDHNMQGLSVSTWIKQNPDGSTLRASVDKVNCLLVTSTSLSAGPDYKLVFSVYENITAGTDPNAFIVPDVCEGLKILTKKMPLEDFSSFSWLYS